MVLVSSHPVMDSLNFQSWSSFVTSTATPNHEGYIMNDGLDSDPYAEYGLEQTTIYWQSTSIIHGGYRVEYEVEGNHTTGNQRYTGEHRYVPVAA